MRVQVEGGAEALDLVDGSGAALLDADAGCVAPVVAEDRAQADPPAQRGRVPRPSRAGSAGARGRRGEGEHPLPDGRSRGAPRSNSECKEAPFARTRHAGLAAGQMSAVNLKGWRRVDELRRLLLFLPNDFEPDVVFGVDG